MIIKKSHLIMFVATGLPQPRKDHAVAMVRFARDCMYKMWSLTKTLEANLGPDTGDLTFRMGLHSGPVTAGVLRGERSRFQLFGDTMNIAAQMESTGQGSSIQLSEDTANLLTAAGKSKWIKPREHSVVTKGKGQMTTFYLDIRQSQSTSVYSSDEGTSTHKDNALAPGEDDIVEKNARQVDWNFEVLSRLLKQIVASRTAKPTDNDVTIDDVFRRKTINPFDEVQEIIEMPQHSLGAEDRIAEIELDPKVAEQLRHLLEKLSSMYKENPFHNCEFSFSK
jgi:hypothetical protein